MLQDALKEFKKRTPKSRKIYAKALQVMPGGVSHNIRTWNLPSVGAYPIHIKAAKGCHIWDVDDNEYVDHWIGHMAAILGHNPEPVVKALEEQLTSVGGTHWGIVNEKQLILAEHVISMVPSVEMIRFCCSGTEATMYATRLARGYTGKRIIIKSLGGWHGYNPLLNWYHNKPFEEKNESMGQLTDFSKYVKAVPFGDTEKTIKVIRRNKEDLAGAVFEVKMTKIHEKDHDKTVQYLRAVKEELQAHDALLIMDEVITGFRLSPGGAQEYFKVDGDLSTYGKILGGGMHVGAIGGREEIMRLVDPLDWQAEKKHKSDVVWIGGGTFSANPMSMIAGIKTMEILKRSKSIYERLAQRGEEIRSGLRKIFNELGLKIVVLGIQSSFNPDLELLNEESKMEWVLRLLNSGIYGHRPYGYLSSVHSRKDVQKNLIAVESIVENMENELKVALKQ